VLEPWDKLFDGYDRQNPEIINVGLPTLCVPCMSALRARAKVGFDDIWDDLPWYTGLGDSWKDYGLYPSPNWNLSIADSVGHT